MKKNIKFIIIFFFLFGIPFLIFSTEINLFVNYNMITFSYFENLINNKSRDFNVYMEYNPLILIYLNWNKNHLIKNLKEMIADDQVKLFKIISPYSPASPSEKWFEKLQKETDNILFSTIRQDRKIFYLKQPDIGINILNMKEFESILFTIANKNLTKKLDFNINLSLFFFEKIDKVLALLKQYKNLKFNLFITSDTRYVPSLKEINEFSSLIYSIKTKKKINDYEKKIMDLTSILFSVKIFSHPDDLLLNIYPLAKNLLNKNNVSNQEYQILSNKYVTLFDNEYFFTFDIKTGFLKKWFRYDKGESLINFDSLAEKIYIKDKKNIIPVNLNNINYSILDNGLIFSYNSDQSIRIEKNIILENNTLSLTYNIRNNSSKTKNIIFIIENKFSPSMLDNMANLINNFAFYDSNENFTVQYNNDVNSFINLNTGYGIAWNYYNQSNGIEFYKDFYNFTKRVYYKLTLVPHEQKDLTFSYQGKYIEKNILNNFIDKSLSLTNQYFGDYGLR